MRLSGRYTLGICALLIAAGARAQAPPAELPEVVVTATRTQERVEDVANSVSVISGADIERRGDDMTSGALRGSPGLDVTEFGSVGQSAFVSIRGAAPDQVLVQLDGVEVNSPTVGQFDFANLTTDNIDRIEVLRGSGGTLYGSEAIGGVVNVITQRGEGPFHLTTSGEAGSAATHHEVVGVNGAQGPFALSGTASFLASDGFRSINDDYRNFSTVWRADADLVPGGTARAFIRYTNARAGLVNFNVAESELDPDARSRTDFFLAKGEWEHALSPALSYRASLSYVHDNERFRDDGNEEPLIGQPVNQQHIPSEIVTAETQANYLWRQFALTTVGVEFKELSARIFKLTQNFDAEENEIETDTQNFNANRSNVAVYLQEQLQGLDDTLRGTGGLRYDHSDHIQDEVTWSGSGTYLVQATHTRFRLGYAEGFRAPTFDELFGTLGNPNLKPEHSWEIDAGLTQELFDGRLRFEPTYFYRRVTNLIEEVIDQLPGPIAVPENEDEEEGALATNLNARFQGVELIARGQPLPWLTLTSNYTYLNYVTPSGVLLNRPRHRGAFGAAAVRSDLFSPGDQGTASTQVYAVGRRDSADPNDDFEPEQIGGYASTDLSLAYRFAVPLAPLTITATVRNLFNRDYSESIGFPAPPARFLMGFRYQL